MSASCGGVRGFAGAWRDVPRLRTEPSSATAYMRLRGAPAGAAEDETLAQFDPSQIEELLALVRAADVG